MNNKITKQMVSNRQKKKRLFVRTLVMTLFMALFTQVAQAQNNVYMHTGSQTLVGNDKVNFYDSGGKSSGPAYYWERWFQRNEDYTFTFKPETGKKVKVTFKQFTAYTDNNGNSDAHAFTTHEKWALRLNTAELSFYDGLTTDDENLITTYTGGVIEEFTVMADGPMTIHFHSYGYREEGWEAEVEQVATYSLQKPSISFQVCSDDVVLNANNKGATIYYTTNGNDPVVNDPLTTATLYEGPFHVAVNTKVKAIVRVGSNDSGVASLTYTDDDVTPTPGKPTISRNGNIITMAPAPLIGDINETYEVWYKTEEEGAYVKYTEPFEWTTPHTTFYAITKPVSCSEKISEEETLDFDKVQVPDPTIEFVVTNESTGVGTVTITGAAGYVISYTTNGNNPTTTGGAASPIQLTNIAPGTTIKAIAYKDGNTTDYQPSNIVTLICIPGGDGHSGAFGGVVLLDDREDHSWSYYSDGDQPIHKLEPRDIKITYYGNSPAGRTTMTNANESGNNPTSFSATATGVKVGVADGENQDQFIYLKTLEAASENGSGGYPYTAIPNPFQVRPTGASGTGQVEVTTYNKVTSAPSNWSGTYLLVNEGNSIAFAGTVGTSYSGYGDATSVSISNSTISDLGSAAEISIVATGSYYYLMIGNQYLYYGNSGLGLSTNSNDNNRQWSLSYNNGYIRINNRSNSRYYLYCLTNYNLFYATNSTNNVNVTLYKKTTTTTTMTVPGYRGFYAWRIKSLSDGLTIANKQVGDEVYADEEITFNTTKEEGNEVEFEALWAQAYVFVSTSSSDTPSGLNSSVGYERNFIVHIGTTNGNYFPASRYQVSAPVTISGIYPNGTSDGTTAVTATPNAGVYGSYTASNDVKFEYIRIWNDEDNDYTDTYNANAHNFVFGRGIISRWGDSYPCVTTLIGLTDQASSSSNYRMRIESGTFGKVTNGSNVGGIYLAGRGVTFTGKVSSVFGCDYDRAKNNNDDLVVNTEVCLGERYVSGNNAYAATIGSTSSIGAEALNCVVKSGNYDWGNYAGNYQFYISAANSDVYASRKLLVEGGVFADIAGGIEDDGYVQNIGDHLMVDMRFKGGTVKGALFGAAQFANTGGHRRMVITGGTFDAWIAGGCNGTRTTGGELYGDASIYFGGKAQVGNENGGTYAGGNVSYTQDNQTYYGINGADGGIIFGAGCGINPTNSSYQPNGNYQTNTVGRVNNSTVVVADEAIVWRDVYGGGNFGYVRDNGITDVHILGGVVKGNVYGGANSQQSQTVNVEMTKGTVNGSIYGGSNTWGTNKKGATVSVSGGTVTNVFGGGLGSNTNMAVGTEVNISGGTINNNVYGGGEEGTVSGTTNVTVSGGTMKDVYGAGKGATSSSAEVSGQTNVTVTGGTVANVYGGGEAGDVVAGSGSGSGTSSGDIILSNNVTQAIAANTTYNFYDSGGSSGNYSNSQSYTATFTCDGDITISFTSFATESSSSCYDWDYMLIYDGTTSGTQLARGQSGCSSSTISAGSSFTATSGTMTIKWESDGSNVAAGWAATITGSGAGQTVNAVASTVTINGGNVSGDVFGGGKLGKTTGNTQVNVESGNVRGSVFGGALGEANKVFVAGQHTVNIMGGRVFGSVYGGSRNANDALAFTGYDTNEKGTNAIVNISAGQVDQQVYAAGYYGKTFGSVFAFIGKDAILNAPHSEPSFGDDNDVMYKADNLRLANNVWAGGDWGTFQSGSFGASTVSGYSSIYVDGTGYDTETTSENDPTYMNIGGSLFGCGTSCDAGKAGRTIMVRNYGAALGGSKNDNFPEPYSEATRTLYSIQRADTLIFDNAHVNLAGHAQVNSLDPTQKYSIYSFDKTVRMVNGSSLFLNAVTTQIMDFWSASCTSVYAAGATYTPVDYDAVSSTPNKIRVNGGNYIEIYHDKMIEGATPGYGMLNGFAYMMVAESSSDNTCAYARPKQCDVTPIADGLDNPDDGGWVSYDADKNTFNIDGETVEGGSSDQMPYENHVNSTKNGEQYFRIWRAGGRYSERTAVFNVKVDGTDSFGYVDVSVNLPAWVDADSYYAFLTTEDGNNTTTDYGSDVMMYNAAMTGDNAWVYFNEQSEAQVSGVNTTGQNKIKDNPNSSFGLITMAGTAMAGNPLIVCNESDHFLADTIHNNFTCGDFEKNPQVTFRLTYHNSISTNMTWDPMYITLVQVDKDGNVTDIVKIICTINTYTSLDQQFVTQTYAIMNGLNSPNEEYVAKVVLPTFDIYDPTSAHESQFKLKSVTFVPESGNDATTDSWILRGGNYDISHFAMEVGAALNEDNTDAWNGTSTGMWDSKTNENGTVLLGETGGREPFAFDFRLTYKGNITYTGDRPRLGRLTFTIEYDNVKLPVLDENDEPVYVDGEQQFYSGTKQLIIHVDVIRRGAGRAFYIDGQHGSNANDGKHPDEAVLSLNTIYNRCGYLPGDVIYIVNAVDVAKELEWSGTKYNNVTIYRYPGGHELSKYQKKDNNGNPLYYDENEQETTTVTDNPVWVYGVIEDNENNEAYTGTLINVKGKGNMTIRDITLDGHKVANGDDAAVAADEPMIDIANGGTLILTMGTTLQNNSSKADGGAVAVNDGGKLMMNGNATLADNETGGEGGGVYMMGTMIVSDSIQIKLNYLAGGQVLNNVYLYSNDDNHVYDKVIQIGTTSEEDAFGALTEKARIGVTKDLTADVDGYTRVLYVEDQNDIAWLDVPFNSTPNEIVYHDGRMYQLVQYTSPQYLYWIGTWVTVQYWNPKYASNEADGYDANDFDSELSNINTPEKLAWLISYVNGLNGADAHQNVTATITAQIDMDESIWVPIGTKAKPFTGTFNGNGYTIEGIRSPLVNTSMGMFGYTEGATIQNMVAEVSFTGNSVNLGSVTGTMKGGTVANVEAAGVLQGQENTLNMGGLVGESSNGATIHSSFAVNTMTASSEATVVGGLVGTNGANLYNSYANVTLGDGTAAATLGGLVGVNAGTIENCYVINPIGPAFAAKNNGTINYCYAAEGTTNFAGAADEGVTATMTGHGTYGAVLNRKDIGYMYGDNAVDASNNTYVSTAITYTGGNSGKIDRWPGLLSTLNQWVKVKNAGYTQWLRPITKDINGDLPVLCFPADSCLATIDGKFLNYNASLDTLLNEYNKQAATAQLFLYKNAVDVALTPASHVFVSINEDAVLLQKQEPTGSKANEPNFTNTTVGITFDNSCKNADDYFGNQLLYDWHLMSTPLNNAPLGITYTDAVHNWWDAEDQGQVDDVKDSYMPNHINDTVNVNTDKVKWDFYTYDEPNYHWVNFKRSMANHYHYDEPHLAFTYTGTEQTSGKLTPGRGYMMAISQDSYLNNTGTLNNGEVPIALTVSDELPETETPSKDWGSNLVGNPYHAYLDLNEVARINGMNTNLEGFYVYDADNGVYGPYMTGASVNTATPSQYIHPHQAFFVVTTTEKPDFKFTYAMATHTSNTTSYFRGEQQPMYPLVNFFMENEKGNRDLAVIEFNRPELNGLRKVNNLRNANFKVSAFLEGQNYGIVFVPEGTERVPVHFRTMEDGTFTLRWQTMHGNFTSLILVDNLTGTRTNMLTTDHYTFNGSVDDYAARFYITFNVTGVNELNGNEEAFAWFDGNDWIVTGKGQLQVVDVTGRVLQSVNVNGDQTRLNLDGYAAGVYVMRLTDGIKSVSQKIVVK